MADNVVDGVVACMLPSTGGRPWLRNITLAFNKSDFRLR